jgi:hypothetical protein
MREDDIWSGADLAVEARSQAKALTCDEPWSLIAVGFQLVGVGPSLLLSSAFVKGAFNVLNRPGHRDRVPLSPLPDFFPTIASEPIEGTTVDSSPVDAPARPCR